MRIAKDHFVVLIERPHSILLPLTLLLRCGRTHPLDRRGSNQGMAPIRTTPVLATDRSPQRLLAPQSYIESDDVELIHYPSAHQHYSPWGAIAPWSTAVANLC
jgi:hypothetical protein